MRRDARSKVLYRVLQKSLAAQPVPLCAPLILPCCVRSKVLYPTHLPLGALQKGTLALFSAVGAIIK